MKQQKVRVSIDAQHPNINIYQKSNKFEGMTNRISNFEMIQPCVVFPHLNPHTSHVYGLSLVCLNRMCFCREDFSTVA